DQLTRGHDAWQGPYEAQRRLRVEQLALMARYAESAQCRMVSLVKHFGDQTDRLAPCGQCDVCDPAGCVAATFERPTAREVAVLAEVVARLRALPGQSMGRLCKEVLGEAPEARPRFERLVRGLARAGQLRLEDAVFEKDGQAIAYQRLFLAGDADPTRALLAPVHRPAPKRPERAPRQRGRGRGRHQARQPAVELPSTGASAALVEVLRAWRLAEAKRRRVPAFRVLTNRALVAVAEARPTTPQALQRVKGLGPKVLSQSGAQLLALCAAR
ncbi:MAG: HRDC domain-containing protein, partial [Myxococcaceae bacterium]|nr:HRDC domain-containing protein [Myxococcaceae bacterium]